MDKYSTVSFKSQMIFIGIDVHKHSWAVTLRHCHRDLEKFSMNPSPKELAIHINKKYPEAIFKSVYEAGFSGFWAHRQLCELGIENIVINPADVPTSGKERDRKNDIVDSRKLARELENGTLEPIHIPTEENLQLRNLVRREKQVTNDIVRIKNRIKGYLNFMGLKFISWSGSSLEIMKIEAEKCNNYTLLSLLRGLRSLRLERLTVITDERKCLKQLNRECIQENLQSIPGIGFKTAIVLQAEIWDFSRFANKNSLSSYCGFAPRLVGSGEHEVLKSAGNRKHKAVHSILIEAAWRAIGFNMELRAKYGSLLRKGRTPQKAISVVAKHLLFMARAVWLQERKFVLPPENEVV